MINDNKNKKKIVLTTGGTGGHIFPTIVISNILRNNNYDVVVVGDEQLIKYENFIECEYKIIKTGKTKKIKDLFAIVKAVCSSYFFLKKFKPDLIVGFGSYATFPILVAGKHLNIPLFLHESNSSIGDVNRWFSQYAKCIMTNFPEIYGIKIDNTDKIEVVGMPVREEILELSNIKYNYSNFEKNEKFNIFITAGSGGANFFSRQLLEAFEKLDKNIKKNIHVIHQARLEDLDKVKEFYTKYNIASEVKIFFTDIIDKYKIANLVICRAGTGTISEIATIGLPTIFIPSPNVLNDHQTKNIDIFVKQNACIMQKENDFDADEFAKILEKLILNKENKLLTMKDNIRQLSNKNSNINFLNCINKFFNN